ncbi:hypothetical protein N9414_19487 [Nodularia spumigena CCY9414]|nr:hypothetical protein N9414_19487 [Nodularia spumigena CCY9414]
MIIFANYVQKQDKLASDSSIVNMLLMIDHIHNLYA